MKTLIAVAVLTLFTVAGTPTRGARLPRRPSPTRTWKPPSAPSCKHEPKAELTDEKLQNVYVLEAARQGDPAT